MATKRMTDAEKWKDPFFEQLNNEAKLAWLYLLDDCDNAGIWLKSLKRLNSNCNSNFTEDDLYDILKNRIVVISADRWFIPKFLTFQYGVDWIKSKNKAVISAKIKLEALNLIIDDTLSIPYGYPTDRAKDQEQDKVQDKVQVKIKDKYKDKVEEYSKEMDIDIDTEFKEIQKQSKL
jgi:hypothetical protein